MLTDYNQMCRFTAGNGRVIRWISRRLFNVVVGAISPSYWNGDYYELIENVSKPTNFASEHNHPASVEMGYISHKEFL